jgi:hypothetical protein
MYKKCDLLNKTDLICKVPVRKGLTEFNKANEVSGGFYWQSKKFGETSCPTTKRATNGSAQDSADYFDIYFF